MAECEEGLAVDVEAEGVGEEVVGGGIGVVFGVF